MNDEILEKWKEKTKGLFNIVEWTRFWNYITNLQQENERLKTKTKEQSLLLIDYQDMEQKLEDYKSRIEKAIEYLKENACYIESNIFVDDLCCDECMELLDILNGRSDK